jgi:hypothetical protein
MGKVVDFAAYRAVRRRRQSRVAQLLALARAICARALARGGRRGLPPWGAIDARLRAGTAPPARPARVVALRRPERG